MKITVVGLGSGDIQGISLGAYEKITQEKNVFLRTKEHPIVMELENRDFSFHSFDPVYNEAVDFDQVYSTIVDLLLQYAREKGEIIYAVPGHPRVSEKSVDLLLEKQKDLNENLEVDIISSSSFLEDMFVFLDVDPTKQSFTILDALNFNAQNLNGKSDMVFTQVYNQNIASQLKLSLMEKFIDEMPVFVFKGAGITNLQEKKLLPLYEIDQVDFDYDHLTSVFVPFDKTNLRYHSLEDLMEVISQLRGEFGCPWDKKQNPESILPNIYEEMDELKEAVENQDIDNIIEEIGDVLMLLTMEAQFGEEAGYFNMLEAVDGIVKKLIFRHPHVFGDEKAHNLDEANDVWEKQKNKQKLNKV